MAFSERNYECYLSDGDNERNVGNEGPSGEEEWQAKVDLCPCSSWGGKT